MWVENSRIFVKLEGTAGLYWVLLLKTLQFSSFPGMFLHWMENLEAFQNHFTGLLCAVNWKGDRNPFLFKTLGPGLCLSSGWLQPTTARQSSARAGGSRTTCDERWSGPWLVTEPCLELFHFPGLQLSYILMRGRGLKPFLFWYHKTLVASGWGRAPLPHSCLGLVGGSSALCTHRRAMMRCTGSSCDLRSSCRTQVLIWEVSLQALPHQGWDAFYFPLIFSRSIFSSDTWKPLCGVCEIWKSFLLNSYSCGRYDT